MAASATKAPRTAALARVLACASIATVGSWLALDATANERRWGWVVGGVRCGSSRVVAMANRAANQGAVRCGSLVQRPGDAIKKPVYTDDVNQFRLGVVTWRAPLPLSTGRMEMKRDAAAEGQACVDGVPGKLLN